MSKIIIIIIAIIIGLILIVRPALNLYNECAVYFHKKAFIAKYEFEDFSQFNGVSVFIRGGDNERNPILCVNAPHLVNDSSKVGYYFVTLDRKNYQVIRAKWTVEYYVNADTLQLQHLAQTFIKYKIPRLDVDKQGNVFVYLADVETLALARFEDESEFHKNPNQKWKSIKGNWYKPK